MNDKEVNGEVVVYQPDEVTRLKVRVEDETVWLTQSQMVELFLSSKQRKRLFLCFCHPARDIPLLHFSTLYSLIRDPDVLSISDRTVEIVDKSLSLGH